MLYRNDEVIDIFAIVSSDIPSWYYDSECLTASQPFLLEGEGDVVLRFKVCAPAEKESRRNSIPGLRVCNVPVISVSCMLRVSFTDKRMLCASSGDTLWSCPIHREL